MTPSTRLHSLSAFKHHAFFVFLVICMLVLSSVLIALMKHIQHIVHVYVVAYPHIGLMGHVHKDCKVALILLIAMIAVVAVFLFSYVFVMLSAGKREMHLCATLIKQMEATQQAERKSMKKSLAFASASHDVRAALAGITGLIDLSYHEVVPGSELETNLRQMDSCTKDLLGILNSILDTSKIEAGKMQLEEDEFDMAQLIEDVVDLFHPVGMKKGVDVMLDPCDGSILKFSRVKGDRGRFKQIMCNLLSNAVKFTSQGHVTVRAWVEKPSFKNSIAASDRRRPGVTRQLLCWFSNNKKAQCDDDLESAPYDPNSLEYVFEVDDTGVGIPREKQKSVFEEYVQVKETGLGEGGTGLGLGIVQSLVHLMRGEIGIVDKEMGESGTCFKFNVLLTPTTVCDNVPNKDGTPAGVDVEMGGPSSSSDGRFNQHLGIAAHSPSSGLNMCTPSPRLNIRTPNPKADGPGSTVVLLMKNEERRRITQKFMENLGIKVMVVQHWEQLAHTLEKAIVHKGGYHSRHQSSSSGISDLGLQDCLTKSTSCNSRGKEVPLINSMDGTENTSNILSMFKRTSLRGGSGFVLAVIDATAGSFPEMCKIVTEFKTGLLQNSTSNYSNWCRVVWLANHSINLNDHERVDMFDPEDVIKHKALHGSRLYQVIRLLPEFGGAMPKKKATFQQHLLGKVSASASSSRNHQFHTTDDESEIVQESHNVGGAKIFSPTHQPVSRLGSTSRNSPVVVTGHPPDAAHGDQIQAHANPSKPLSGKKFLVAEDIEINRRLAMLNLTRLGATVGLCENGREALDLVRNGLLKEGKHPFDYILMDCEMPEMDGFEATRQIRKEEEAYGVHIPIIALTGHAPGEERRRRVEAGMDHHLSKPFQREQLLEIVMGLDATTRTK